MSRAFVSYLLAVHLCVVWTAVVFRLDFFPLTWAPMYSVLKPGDTIHVPVWDRSVTRTGLDATRRDGSREHISGDELNVPTLSFWRLYYERMFEHGPNKFIHGNAEMGALNRWVRGIQLGEEPYRANWGWRVLRSVNATLGRRPSDPDFIVQLEAHAEVVHFPRSNVEAPSQTREHATFRWNERWSMCDEPR